MPIVVTAADATPTATGVTVAKVATELARPDPASPVSDQWQSWINRAYRIVEDRLGATTYAAIDPAKVDDVVLVAVTEHVRAWRDSTVKRSTTTIDDGTISREYDSGVGLLEIPDSLLSSLLPQVGVLGGAYSIPLGSPWSMP